MLQQNLADGRTHRIQSIVLDAIRPLLVCLELLDPGQCVDRTVATVVVAVPVLDLLAFGVAEVPLVLLHRDVADLFLVLGHLVCKNHLVFARVRNYVTVKTLKLTFVESKQGHLLTGIWISQIGPG